MPALADANFSIRQLRDHKPPIGHSNDDPAGRLGLNDLVAVNQAAIGRVQLRKLDDFNRRRVDNAKYLTQRLNQVQGLVPPPVVGDAYHVFWQYTIRIKEEELGISRDRFRAALEAEGVESSVYYDRPIYQQPYFLELRGYGNTACPFRCPWYTGVVDYAQLRLPVAEKACQEVLSLPVHNLLGIEDMERVATAVEKVANA